MSGRIILKAEAFRFSWLWFGSCYIKKLSPQTSTEAQRVLPLNLLEKPVMVFISQSAVVSGYISLQAKT